MKFVIGLLATTLLSLNCTAAELSADQILKKSDARRGLKGSFYMSAKTLSIDGSDRQIQSYDVKILNDDTSLVEQTMPERARGRKLLMRGLDMWLQTPDIKKPVRISLKQRLTGEIQNGDISRTNYSGDYEAKIVDSESNADFYVLDLKAINDKVTYDRIKYWIKKAGFFPQKAEYYAASGKLLKTATFGAYRKIAGQEVMTKVSIQDSLNKNKRSEMIYSKHRAKTFPESLFNKEQMGR